jgi:hypothetical protein
MMRHQHTDTAATLSDNDLLRRLAEIAGAAVRTHIPSPTCWCNPVPDQVIPSVWLHSDYQPDPHAVTQGEDAAP